MVRSVVAGIAAVTTASALLQEPSRPVSQVISVLKKMQTQLETEKEEDEALEKKMSCWCTKTDAEKSDAIAKAGTAIDQLTASISAKGGKVETLNEEAAELRKNIKSEQESLAIATKLRNEAVASFNAEEKDLVENISALQAAITVLKKHHSLAQMPVHQQKSIKQAMAKANISAEARLQIDEMLQQPTFNAYGTQSGEIFGILEAMLDNFKADLERSRGDEAADIMGFEATKKAKEESIASMTTFKNQKEVTSAETLASKEADEQVKVETETQKAADEAYLADMRADCSSFQSEYDGRAAERSTEAQAVATAIEFLNSDEAHDLFNNTFNSFVQVSSSSSAQKQKAERLLMSIGQRFSHPQITALAQDVKASAFEKVKSSIDMMVADLKAQIEMDKTEKDTCVTDLNQYDSDIAQTIREQGDLTSKKESLGSKISVLQKDIENLDEQIAASHSALDDASTLRERENKAFQEMVADQTSSIELLQKTLDVLKQVYATYTPPALSSASSLLQKKKQDPKPEGFETYSKNEGGQKVLALLDQIIADATRAKALAIEAEADAQKGYETMVKDTNDTLKKYGATKTAKKGTLAGRKEDLQHTVNHLDHTTVFLGELNTKRTARADECQFLMNNFDLRQEHMTKEIEALQSAKAFLEGMK